MRRLLILAMLPETSANPTTIAVRRHRALMIVRSGVVVLAIFGGIPFCYSIGLLFVMRDIDALTMMWNDTNYFAWGISFLVPAVVLFWFDRRIVRWLIPVPRRECPECGYPMRGLAATTRCPECGTPLAASSGDSVNPRA